MRSAASNTVYCNSVPSRLLLLVASFSFLIITVPASPQDSDDKTLDPYTSYFLHCGDEPEKPVECARENGIPDSVITEWNQNLDEAPPGYDPSMDESDRTDSAGTNSDPTGSSSDVSDTDQKYSQPRNEDVSEDNTSDTGTAAGRGVESGNDENEKNDDTRIAQRGEGEEGKQTNRSSNQNENSSTTDQKYRPSNRTRSSSSTPSNNIRDKQFKIGLAYPGLGLGFQTHNFTVEFRGYSDDVSDLYGLKGTHHFHHMKPGNLYWGMEFLQVDQFEGTITAGDGIMGGVVGGMQVYLNSYSSFEVDAGPYHVKLEDEFSGLQVDVTEFVVNTTLSFHF